MWRQVRVDRADVAIAGTHKILFVTPAEDNQKIMVGNTSITKNYRKAQLRRVAYDNLVSNSAPVPQLDAQHNYSVGNWVLFAYDNTEYAGEVCSIGNTDVQVNVMHLSGRGWKWPLKPDKYTTHFKM